MNVDSANNKSSCQYLKDVLCNYFSSAPRDEFILQSKTIEELSCDKVYLIAYGLLENRRMQDEYANTQKEQLRGQASRAAKLPK